jgi:hypothetical protein
MQWHWGCGTQQYLLAQQVALAASALLLHMTQSQFIDPLHTASHTLHPWHCQLR